MKTLIAVPCMDQVHTAFFKSAMDLNRIGETALAISASSLVYDARNALVAQAILGGFDRILWLDSDMQFTPDLMEKLMADMDELKCDIVSGLYFTRRAPIKPVCYSYVGFRPEGEGLKPVAESFMDYPKDSIFEVAGVGFGAVLVTVDLCKRVREHYGLPFSPALGFGEDLSFCARATELGVKIYCDSRIKLGHAGLMTVTEQLYEETRN